MSRLGTLRAYARARIDVRYAGGGRGSFERWQDAQVQKAFADVLPHSTYYRELYEGYDTSNWRSLPTIDKAAMMSNFDALNTEGVTLREAMDVALRAETTRNFAPNIQGRSTGELTVGLSSGTSGNRSLFLASEEDRDTWAGTILAKLLPGGLLSPRRDRVAFFLRANSNLYESVRSRRLEFHFFDLFDELDEHLRRLRDLKPTLLIAPPSMLRLLGAAQSEGRLQIRPERVISVAEVLEPIDERFIRRRFRQTVHQVYQATEGFLGHSCAFGTVHLAEDAVVIQREPIAGDSGRRFKPIITDFRRRAQPIFRYRLSDILVERRIPCLCASPYIGLEAIEGRADDVFYLRRTEGERYRPVFPDFLRRALLYASPDIEAYGVRQVSLEAIEVYLALKDKRTEGSVRDAVVREIRGLCQRLGCTPPNIEFLGEWRRARGAKLKRVERVCEAPREERIG